VQPVCIDADAGVFCFRREDDGGRDIQAVECATVALPSDPEPDLHPQIDDAERFLAMRFLRRYVTYCVRRGRWESMMGAAGLSQKLAQIH